MTSPIDAVMAIHNAFRHDMSLIDAAALDSARGKPGLEATAERFRFFNEVLEWHAHGEELAIFPALEAVAPSVAEAYEKDHRALDAAFNALNKAVSVHDPLETARATKAFSAFTSTKRMPTCTASSKSACRCPTRARQSVSWPAPSPRIASRSWWRGCSR